MRDCVRRHQLVYVNPELCGGLDETVSGWSASGFPGIVRRPCFSENGNICLGIPLPPSRGKLRLSCEVTGDAVEKITPPPELRNCAAAFPENKREGLNALLEIAPFQTHVVGSLAWESITGITYLTESSDIDLLFMPSNKDEFYKIDKTLENWRERFKIKCDIEIMFPNGNGFLWKEYKQSPRKFLVKGNSKVFMSSPEQLGI